MPKEQQKTERLAGLFDVVGHGSQQTSALCPFETPYVELRHLKSGRTFRYVSDRSLRLHTARWAMDLLVRGSRVYRLREAEVYDVGPDEECGC